MHLERILHSQGFGSRKACRALIRAGDVSVAGEPCDNPFAEFAPEGLCFNVDGEDWTFQPQAYLLLNKPAGYECSRQPRHHPSVFALLPEALLTRGVQSVGRLDEDTRGLLLFSDDGQFIHRMSSPKKKVGKTYAVSTKHPVSPELVSQLLTGVVLHDDPAPVVAVACVVADTHLLHLTITEGRYHQVKRMVAAAGNRVEALSRIRIGDLALPGDLPEGQWRWLTATELAAAQQVWEAPPATT